MKIYSTVFGLTLCITSDKQFCQNLRYILGYTILEVLVIVNELRLL